MFTVRATVRPKQTIRPRHTHTHTTKKPDLGNIPTPRNDHSCSKLHRMVGGGIVDIFDCTSVNSTDKSNHEKKPTCTNTQWPYSMSPLKKCSQNRMLKGPKVDEQHDTYTSTVLVCPVLYRPSGSLTSDMCTLTLSAWLPNIFLPTNANFNRLSILRCSPHW